MEWRRRIRLRHYHLRGPFTSILIMQGGRLCTLAALTLVSGVFGSASISHAATVSVSGERVDIVASGAELNEGELSLVWAPDATTITFGDSSTAPVAGKGCEQQGVEVTCVVPGLNRVDVALGPLNDSLVAISEAAFIELNANLGHGDDEAVLGPGGALCDAVLDGVNDLICTLQGGAGKDALTGSDGFDDLDGQGGEDALAGGDGSDFMTGGRGSDRLRGGRGSEFMTDRDPGDDVLEGGPGDDTIDDRGGSDTLRGGPGPDRFRSFDEGPKADDVIRGGKGVETYIRWCGACRVSMNGKADDGALRTGENDDVVVEQFIVEPEQPEVGSAEAKLLGDGSDRLRGGPADNKVFGFKGPDAIWGGPGRDLIAGGPANDTLHSDDGEIDIVKCGPQRDKAFVDRQDDVRNCEGVVVR